MWFGSLLIAGYVGVTLLGRVLVVTAVVVIVGWVILTGRPAAVVLLRRVVVLILLLRVLLWILLRRRTISRRIRIAVRRCVRVTIIRRVGISIIGTGIVTQSKPQPEPKIGSAIATIITATAVTISTTAGAISTTTGAIATMATKPSSTAAMALGLARENRQGEDRTQDDNFFHSVCVF